MENKYKIETWSPNGSQPMYRIIMGLISELNESLKTPLMEESKNDEEVRRILNNPEGIRIRELQVIDVWDIEKELRKKLRDELDEAYVFLSTEAAQLIADRNEIGNRAEEGNIGINDENRKLKGTILNQCEVIEKMVKDYEKKGTLSEKERKLLVYVRKVYSKALKEATKNLFSTASSSTERVKIFPREEQRIISEKINSLQERIRSLTRESKKNQKIQQKESYEKLELNKKESEERLISLKNTLNDSFPDLIDSENKINEEVQKSIIKDLIKLKEIQQQLSSKPTSPKVSDEGEVKKEVQVELDKINDIKIEEISDEECLSWLAKFKRMKGSTKNKEQGKAVMEITNKLRLEERRRKWRQAIEHFLIDEDNEGKEGHVKLEKSNLTEVKYIDFVETLQEKKSKGEIDEFGREMIKEIVEQRQKHLNIIRLLEEGWKVIESKDIEQAEEILVYLEVLQRLAEYDEGERKVFRSKIVEINRLKRNIRLLVEAQQNQETQVQIIQNNPKLD